MSLVTGVGLTPFGRLEGRGTLDLMSEAAAAALADAGVERRDVDGLVTGYSTVLPHLMLSTVFAEHFGLKPDYAHAIQLGGATGFAMVMLAHLLVESGAARRILVVAGENRLTGQSRDSAIGTLAQVGHPIYEVPLGPTVPAYYGLVASRYMHEFGSTEADFAELAVLMRQNAARTPGAQLREPITVADVLASKPIATPLKLLDCCPVSDGGCAFIIERDDPGRRGVAITGAAQAHTHQHVTAAPSLTRFGAADSSRRALEEASRGLADMRYAAIYDSFTITLAILLEEIGLAPRGRSGALARDGHFSPGGAMPLNTHGGLLSYGHCGVGGAMAHLAETFRQMTGRAGDRAIVPPALALLHGDGGVLSSHVSLVMEERMSGVPNGNRNTHPRGPHPEVPGEAGPRRTQGRAASFEAGLRPAPQDEERGSSGEGRSGHLTYDRCRACGSVQYFHRTFCPVCGSEDVEVCDASGAGTVHAITTVHRAPSAELRAFAPYRIALIDAAEGFRSMAHAAEGLAIGDPVRIVARPFGATPVPFAEPARPA